MFTAKITALSVSVAINVSEFVEQHWPDTNRKQVQSHRLAGEKKCRKEYADVGLSTYGSSYTFARNDSSRETLTIWWIMQLLYQSSSDR